jgi:hypothetical protein
MRHRRTCSRGSAATLVAGMLLAACGSGSPGAASTGHSATTTSTGGHAGPATSAPPAQGTPTSATATVPGGIPPGDAYIGSATASNGMGTVTFSYYVGAPGPKPPAIPASVWRRRTCKPGPRTQFATGVVVVKWSASSSVRFPVPLRVDLAPADSKWIGTASKQRGAWSCDNQLPTITGGATGQVTIPFATLVTYRPNSESVLQLGLTYTPTSSNTGAAYSFGRLMKVSGPHAAVCTGVVYETAGKGFSPDPSDIGTLLLFDAPPQSGPAGSCTPTSTAYG